jgi:crotonobetainyl-CoA:carnitine CoA-transferase CaiB-like acyl-CoA transferase
MDSGRAAEGATRPLEHIRVLDLTRVLAGPWATQNLADLGADVIKIERPGVGDETRSWGPPWLRDVRGRETTESAYYLSVNRGKRSVTIDLAAREGQALVRELARRCDVLVENFKVGDLARYGLAYDDLRDSCPRLIYCSITGFGQTGPDAGLPGYDFVFQAIGGLMSITGERDDRPGGGPQKVGIAVTDVMAGMYASLAITAAIAHRERTGVGQHIDLALFDAIVAFGSNQILNYWCSGRVPARHGNAHANIAPYQVFRCADQEMVLAVGNDVQFAAFCRVAGRPELARDPRFATNPERVRQRQTLIPVVQQILADRPAADWVAELSASGVPCGLIQNMKQVFERPQAQHRGLRVEMAHPSGVPCPAVASPMRFSETPIRYDIPPPLLGQHTAQVLGELLGLEGNALSELAARGVISMPDPVLP